MAVWARLLHTVAGNLELGYSGEEWKYELHQVDALIGSR